MSYSHVDSGIARELHRRLERYVVPRRLRSESQGKRLGLIFRDNDELAASGELSDALKASLEQSAALIVVCSPAAAASRWVDAEIAWFQQCHPDAPIACVIVEGEPGDPNDECFPPSLIDSDASHSRLSADLRPGKGSTQDAVLRLAASLLGVGFDELKQRHQTRHIRLLLASNVAGLSVAAALGLLAWLALEASDAAERRQAQAERLVSFMLGDLRARLEPIGRLDVLDAVGDEATSYFISLDDADETDAVLLSRAKAMRQIGDVRMRQGRLADAVVSFDQARSLNELLVKRDPEDSGRIFELAQAEFWVGYAELRNNQTESARTHMAAYLRHSETLVRLEPANPDYALEVAFANSNLGTLTRESGDLVEAADYFASAAETLKSLQQDAPDNALYKAQLAQVISWQSTTALQLGNADAALTGFADQEIQLRELAEANPGDRNARWTLAVALLLQGEALALYGDRQTSFARVEEALTVLEELTRHDPDNQDWQRNLGRALRYRARLLESSGELAAAVADYERSLNVVAALVARDADNTLWKNDYEEALATLLRVHELRDRRFTPEIETLTRALGDASAATNPLLDCRLTRVRTEAQACPEATRVALANSEARPYTDAYTSLYSVLRAQDDPRQDGIWEKLTQLGVKDKDFVDTL